MTNEEALDILERQLECANGNCPEPRISCIECPYNVDAIDYNRACKMAIEALSKQCASSEQADKKLFGHGYWIVPGEVFISHNVLNDVLGQSAENDEDGATDDQCGDDTEMVDQFREDTKKTDDVLINLPSAQPETNCSEIPNGSDTISRRAAIDAVLKLTYADGAYGYTDAKDLVDSLENLPSAQPEIIRCNSCKHWTQTTGKMKGYGLGKCDYLNADLVTCNGFCYWAERRNDG